MTTELTGFGENILEMLRKIETNKSNLYFGKSQGIHTDEYYFYCCELILQCLKERKDSEAVNVIFGPQQINIENNLRTVRLDIQPEHTLVKKGGRSVTEKIEGNIPVTNRDEKYLVRICNFDYYKSLDGVIEYSIPNIINMQTCDSTKICEYANKCKYIAPSLYNDNLENKNRKGTFTLFSLGASPRRDEFLKTTGVENISGVFFAKDLINIYRSKAIMINIHQTNHHHTFEELRVLPALSQGVVVVAEDSPLKEHIPYSDSIIWSSFKNVKDVVRDVENNYEKYRKKLFSTKFVDTLQQLRRDNVVNMKELIWQR